VQEANAAGAVPSFDYANALCTNRGWLTTAEQCCARRRSRSPTSEAVASIF
jgi:hypothetical protein